ncbi:MAG: cation diffusion facilitator family transporter [Thermoanaerobaculia bacterium]
MNAHDHAPSVSRKLVVSTVITVVFIGIEVGAGVYANSLSLIGDGLHNFTDALALLLALAAVRLERRPPTAEKSYGYQRAGVLAAFVNAAALAGFTIYLLVEAYHRFRRPEQVEVGPMLLVAALALAMNSGLTVWLHKEGKHDLSIRSAVLHMLGDALSSAGIIVAAILIRITGSAIFDPLVTVVIALLILWSSWEILREAVNLLLEGTPRGIDARAVHADLASLEGVFGVHDLHIWALAPSRPALSCHLMLGDVSLRASDEILQRANTILQDRYQIEHTTIQLEHAACAIDDSRCASGEGCGPIPVGSRTRRDT